MILCQRCLSRNADDAATCAQCGSALIPEWVSAVRREASAPMSTLREEPALAEAPGEKGHAGPSRDTLAPAGFSPSAFPLAPEVVDGGASPPRSSGKSAGIVVRLMLTESGYLFELMGKSEYLVGRRDSQAGLTPDVDLTDWNGAASGVSRRHAIIHVEDGAAYIEDLGSRNETVRNNTRLLTGKRYPLASGDTIQLGTLTLAITVLEV
jgi:hypothetical protein